MAENPIEELLKKLINDPALLKNLETMAKQSVKDTLKEKQRKRELDRFGSLDYVNKIVKTCKLCGSASIFYAPMIWDKIDKLHRASCLSGILCEEWTLLELRTVRQTALSCNCCAEVLMSTPKETLIKMLITRANMV